jgi:hypothetical protein
MSDGTGPPKIMGLQIFIVQLSLLAIFVPRPTPSVIRDRRPSRQMNRHVATPSASLGNRIVIDY